MKYIIVDDNKDKLTIKKTYATIIITNYAVKEAKKFIHENFDEILTFIANKGYIFQIRFNKNDFEILPEFIKNTFRNSVNYFYNDDPEDYRKTFYWKPANLYIFKYKIDKCIYIEANIEREIEGYLVKRYFYFLKRNSFPDLILFNFEKDETDPLFIPKSIINIIKENHPKFYLEILRR